MMLVLEERAAEGEGKVASPGRDYSKGMSRASYCLSDSAIWLSKGKLHRCVIPRHIFSQFFPQVYLDIDILWLAGQPVLCCLTATLALSLWWQSSQLKQWSFSLTNELDLADISDHNCFLFFYFLLVYVCVCALLITSQRFYFKWAWQSKGLW